MLCRLRKRPIFTETLIEPISRPPAQAGTVQTDAEVGIGPLNQRWREKDIRALLTAAGRGAALAANAALSLLFFPITIPICLGAILA